MSDGKTIEVQAKLVTVGTVLRMVNDDGEVSPFSDSVVTGIFLEYKNGSKSSHTTVEDCLIAARAEYGKDGAIYCDIHIARPYLYANTIGLCVEHLSGVEVYKAHANNLARLYRIVTMSTGKPASFNNR